MSSSLSQMELARIAWMMGFAEGCEKSEGRCVPTPEKLREMWDDSECKNVMKDSK